MLVVEDVLDQGEELFGRSVLLCVKQSSRSRIPAVSPKADGHARELNLLGNRLDAGVACQGKQDSGTPNLALARGLALTDVSE